MKRRFLTIILAFAFAAGMLFPASAAEAKTVQERIADIRETYAIAVMDGREPERGFSDSSRSNKADFEKNLTQLELALKDLGAIFTKRLARRTGGTFDIYLLFGDDCPDPYKSAVGIAHETYIDGDHDSWIEFLGPKGTSLSARYMLHEFAHCMEFLLTKDPPEDFTTVERRPFSSSAYTNKSAAANSPSAKPDKYVSLRGEMNAREDYAECFRAAVAGGASNPIQYGKNTDVYKKTYEVYMDVAALSGYSSRATKRVAAYLGVEIPQELRGGN